MEKKKPCPKQTNGSPFKGSGRQTRGRKPASESRAPEIRARLTMWKQAPESSRCSLRALAAKLGTSHQLLSFYLSRWDNWQMNEYLRKAQEICTRAEAEKRPITEVEQSQVVAYSRAALSFLPSSLASDMLRELRAEAKRGKLSRQHLRVANLLARKGHGTEIEKIFRSKRLRHQHGTEFIKKNLPGGDKRFAKSFRFD